MEDKLYNIANRFIELQEREDLTEEELQEKAEMIQTALVNKSNNLIAYDRNLTTLEENIDTEIKRLQEYKKRIKTRQENFRNYVKNEMEYMGFNKLETPVGVITLRKNPMSVEVVDESKVPEEFKEIVTSVKINKDAIKKHFKETGELLDGVNIITNKTNIVIK